MPLGFPIITPSKHNEKGQADMTNAHLTIENIEKLAKKINEKRGIPMSDARGLAEFNLQFSKSYADAVNRV